MNRYFYQVEDNGQGGKIIHIQANIYNDGERYYIDEWTFFYIDIDKAQRKIKENTLYNYISDYIDYSDTIDKAEAEEIYNTYCYGQQITELNIEDITDDTPCGYYYFNIV